MNQGNQFAGGLTLASPLRFDPGMRCTLKVGGQAVTVLTEGRDASKVHRQIKIRDESGREQWVHTAALVPAEPADKPNAKQLFRGLEVLSAELVKHRSRCCTCRELYERGIMLSGTCLINRQLISEFTSIQAAWKSAATVEADARDTLW